MTFKTLKFKFLKFKYLKDNVLELFLLENSIFIGENIIKYRLKIKEKYYNAITQR